MSQKLLDLTEVALKNGVVAKSTTEANRFHEAAKEILVNDDYSKHNCYQVQMYLKKLYDDGVLVCSDGRWRRSPQTGLSHTEYAEKCKRLAQARNRRRKMTMTPRRRSRAAAVLVLQAEDAYDSAA